MDFCSLSLLARKILKYLFTDTDSVESLKIPHFFFENYGKNYIKVCTRFCNFYL